MSTNSKLNDLTASQWLFRSKSVMRRNFGTGGQAHAVRRAANKSCKPPELCRDIIENLSKVGDTVLDPFSGTGGILLGAQMANRKAIGYEKDPVQVNAYKTACHQMTTLFKNYDPEAMRCGDFFEACSMWNTKVMFEPLVELFTPPPPFADLVLTDPPWFDLDMRKKSSRWWKGKGSQERPMKPYGTCQFDSIDDWQGFIENFARICKNALKPNKYLAFFMEDAYLDGEYVFLTNLAAEAVKRAGLIPQGEWIWYNEARRACFFGFPSKMITSRTHTSILFFLNSNVETMK